MGGAPASNRGINPETKNGSTIPLAGYENVVPCLMLECGVCCRGWFRWGHTQESLDRAFAAHLNSEQHAASLRTQREREERVERYRQEDLASREPAKS